MPPSSRCARRRACRSSGGRTARPTRPEPRTLTPACSPFAELADENGALENAYGAALELGLECAVEVRNDEELEAALERVDPEIFLLGAGDGGDEGPLERALDLLQDVPAGKLAIAELPVSGRDEVAELERAGMDAVIVPGGNVAELVGGNHPDV